MIKIIEPGTKTVAECNSCGCKFSYEKEDIKHGYYKLPDVKHSPVFLDSYVECHIGNNKIRRYRNGKQSKSSRSLSEYCWR